MNKMVEKLLSLRIKLEEINNLIFKTLSERRDVVFQIQEIKHTQGLQIYDKCRELELFKKDSQRLSKLSSLELLVYSLMIENDANKFDGTYPSWSKKEHLDSISDNSISELINPLLLALFDKKSYSSLNIKHEFQVDDNELK